MEDNDIMKCFWVVLLKTFSCYVWYMVTDILMNSIAAIMD